MYKHLVIAVTIECILDKSIRLLKELSDVLLSVIFDAIEGQIDDAFVFEPGLSVRFHTEYVSDSILVDCWPVLGSLDSTHVDSVMDLIHVLMRLWFRALSVSRSCETRIHLLCVSSKVHLLRLTIMQLDVCL